MQRFKKEYRKVIDGNTPIPLGSVWRRISCDGKFVYGANGTLTQAARWRGRAIEIQEIAADTLRLHCEGLLAGSPSGFFATVRQARLLLDSSRRGGCVLP